VENGYLDVKCKVPLKYQDEKEVVQGLYERHMTARFTKS